jgi:predicted lipoprotein with Yx(FWY)xxD motif
MKTICVLLVALLALSGCGGDDGASESGRKGSEEGVAGTGANGTEPRQGDATTAGDQRSAGKGTRVVLAGSDFGRMLFGSNRQAIYIFERDEKNKSNCYGECAAAWPPVFTEGRPRGGNGVKSSLLGTTRRRDGKEQVTYAGKPLYYYANEGPGEVKCHNVNLNGGFWWAVGADGKRLQ